MTSAICVYDITIPCANNTYEDVRAFFVEHCKKWTFQKEKGEETGYEHYQCRVSLNVKRRFDAMKAFVKMYLIKSNVSITSTANQKNNFYVSKPDTRIEGPWSDTDKIKKKRFFQDKYTGICTWKFWDESRIEDFERFPNWMPFQREIANNIREVPNDRTINFLYDPHGNKGKSFIANFLQQLGVAVFLPPLNECKDIIQVVMNKKKKGTYFLDAPKAISGNNQRAIFSAVEMIKNGYVYDPRNHFRDAWMNPPHVWIFSNYLPEKGMLSEDRLVYWIIDENKSLKMVNRNELEIDPQPTSIPLIQIPVSKETRNEDLIDNISYYFEKN